MAALTSSTRANWNGRMSGLFHFRSSLLDGVHDVRIGSATAQISAHVFANLGVDAGVAFFHAGDCRQDLARSAIAALERVVVDKGLLVWSKYWSEASISSIANLIALITVPVPHRRPG